MIEWKYLRWPCPRFVASLCCILSVFVFFRLLLVTQVNQFKEVTQEISFVPFVSPVAEIKSNVKLSGKDRALLNKLERLTNVAAPWKEYLLDRLRRGNPKGRSPPEYINKYTQDFVEHPGFKPDFIQQTKSSTPALVRFLEIANATNQNGKNNDWFSKINYEEDFVLTPELQIICNHPRFTAYNDPEAVCNNIVYGVNLGSSDFNTLTGKFGGEIGNLNPDFKTMGSRAVLFTQFDQQKDGFPSYPLNNPLRNGGRIPNVINVLGFPDSWKTLGKKDYVINKWITEQCPGASLYVHHDSDTVLHFSKWRSTLCGDLGMKLYLRNSTANPFFYGGTVIQHRAARWGNIYYDSQFHHVLYPRYLTGNLFVHNYEAVQLLTKAVQRYKVFHTSDDVLQGFLMALAGVSPSNIWKIFVERGEIEIGQTNYQDFISKIENYDDAALQAEMANTHSTLWSACRMSSAHCRGHNMNCMDKFKLLWDTICPRIQILRNSPI